MRLIQSGWLIFSRVNLAGQSCLQYGMLFVQLDVKLYLINESSLVRAYWDCLGILSWNKLVVIWCAMILLRWWSTVSDQISFWWFHLVFSYRMMTLITVSSIYVAWYLLFSVHAWLLVLIFHVDVVAIVSIYWKLSTLVTVFSVDYCI